MMKKEDLRVIKTKANLYRGLIDLMKDNPFEEIKVSDICNKSMINRSTFYDHFNDKYELLQSLIDDLKEAIDTSGPLGDCIIAILGAIAQLERDIMLERQRAGIALAKAQGKYKRPKKKQPKFWHDVYKRWLNRETTFSRMAKECNVSKTTIQKWVCEERKKSKKA